MNFIAQASIAQASIAQASIAQASIAQASIAQTAIAQTATGQTIEELSLHPTPTVTWLCAGAMVLVVILAFLAWHRQRYAFFPGILELLRVLIVGGAALTLCQPEWLETFLPETRPTVLVLWDDSTSMTTEDVVSQRGEGALPRSRAEFVKEIIESSSWEPLKEPYELVFESFASPQGVESGTDIHAPLEEALGKYESLRAVVLISDGDWNEGTSPATAASLFRMNDVPIFSVVSGSDVALPDLEVASIDPPTFSVVGKTLQVPYAVKSTMARNQTVHISLSVDDGTELQEEVTLPAMGEHRDVFSWRPERVGEFEITVRIEPHRSESMTDNNQKSVRVSVRPEALKVLVMDSEPRWEYRYLRNALERDPGVEVSCLLFHPGLSKRGGGPGYIKGFPKDQEELSRYDVVFVGDIGMGPDELTAEQCEMLKGLVEDQASGLVFIPGRRGRHLSLLSTALNELYPVQLDNGSPGGFGTAVEAHFVLTELGRRSLLTKLADNESENAAVWRSLPGFHWRAPALRPRAGCDVLAIHETTRTPMVVTKTYGTGKVLFMGTDAAWRWREGVEDKYHYRFWGQVARWMAYQRHMAAGEMMRLFYRPDRPAPRSTMVLNATVLDPSGAPFAEGTVEGEIRGPAGVQETLSFKLSSAEWGLYVARFNPPHSGTYDIALTCNETNSRLDASFSVVGTDVELVGKPAKPDVLREIAQISKGRTVAADEIASMQKQILDLPEPEPLVRRYQIWASPFWGGGIVFLMGAFWVLRKLRGAF